MKDFIDISKTSDPTYRSDSQSGWMKFVGNLYANKTILDVGSGLGYSRNRLAANGNTVMLQDIAPGLPVDIKYDVSEIEDNSYQVVTCFDTLEHVAEDVLFLAQLVRIASEEVVVTTPNWNVSKNGNPAHAREYTPHQLLDLIGPYKIKYLLTGNGLGSNAKIILSKANFTSHNEAHHGFILSKGDNHV